MSISNELRNLIRVSSEREMNDDHLSNSERESIVSRIRVEDNVDSEVSDEVIFEDYIIQ